MKIFNKKFFGETYSDKIRWRIRVLWCVLIAMLVYMVVIGETGGGDSRIMTDLANTFSGITFFGGMIYVTNRIVKNKKLLSNRRLLKEQYKQEEDERNQYLHDKSGGIVMDILLLCLLFVTLTTSLFNMPAFYTSFAILLVAVGLKTIAYIVYSRM